MHRVFGTVHAAFHQPNTRAYGVLQGSVGLLILLSIVLLAVEPIVPQQHQGNLQNVDLGILVLFSLELVLRLASVRPPELEVVHHAPLGRLRAHIMVRVRHALLPLVLIDIVTVLALVPALRGLRAIRMLRLLRSIRVFRYANPFTSIIHALEQDRLLFTFAFGVLATEVAVGGTSIYLIERADNAQIQSLADGLWWAIVTITTVGFGDITPVTGLGRVVAGFMMVGGMFTLALFAGIVGHSLLSAVLSIREEQFRMSNHVNHVIVCGYDSGTHMLLEVLRTEIDPSQVPTVIFANQDRPAEVPPEFFWVQGDPTKESELDKVNVAQASAVVVAGSRSAAPQASDAMTILTMFTIRSYLRKSHVDRRRPLYMIAEILDSENVGHARTAGADEVIETRRVGFSLLAHAVTYHGTADTLSRVVIGGAHNLYVGNLPIRLEAQEPFRDVMRKLKLAERGVLVIGVRSKDGSERLNPPDDHAIDSDTLLLYLAERRVLDAP